MGSDEYVSISATVRAFSPDAVCIEVEGDDFWVPRSCIHGRDDIALRALEVGTEHEFQVRRWLAEKKGMI